MAEDVEVEVEYCGTCGYANKYNELNQHVINNFPDIKMSGYEGRRASFEVKINGVLVHSKLSTMAWPDYTDVNNIITEVSSGNEVRKSKTQPITDCIII